MIDDMYATLAEKDKEIAELQEALKFNEKARDIDFAEITKLKSEKAELENSFRKGLFFGMIIGVWLEFLLLLIIGAIK